MNHIWEGRYKVINSSKIFFHNNLSFENYFNTKIEKRVH